VGSTSTGSWPAWSATRWSSSTGTGRRVPASADGKVSAEVTRGLSAEYIAAVRDFPERSLPSAAIAARRPLYALNYRDDPRGAGIRAAVVQEGYDTICTAPLLDGDEVLGLLNVYHDEPHDWSGDELETISALATQASVAIRTRRTSTRWRPGPRSSSRSSSSARA
jgi:GAF domain-containing protein